LAGVAALGLGCSSEDRTTLAARGIGASTAPLRDMTKAEASQDLEQLFNYVHTLYGPYEYKEQRFGYSIAALEDTARSMLGASPGDDGFYTAANWFLTRLNDGHVSLQPGPDSNPITTYEVGLVLQPVEGKALVAELFDPSLADEGISYGDEVTSVDGVSPFDQLSEYEKVEPVIGNDVSNQHLIIRALIRPGYSAALRPTAPAAHVEFRRADGSEYSRDLVWREVRTDPVPFVFPPNKLPALGKDSFLAQNALMLNAFARGSIATIGATQPFFYNAATSAAFDITPVTPNAQMLAKYGVDPGAVPADIFSALYSYAGKSILLIRQSSYDADDSDTRIAYYRAILDQYDDFADGLIVDQTHNPGGSIQYCVDFARLFLSQPGQNFVEAFNTDRTWINDLRGAAASIDPTLSSEQSQEYELRAAVVEKAYDAGQRLAPPQPLYLDKDLPPDPAYVWTKPRLVLIDELAGSCADVFPMLIKRNAAAPLFGRRTMGLGGNVEMVGTLTNSTAQLNLTRGLFTTHRDDETYPKEGFVENNGVQPDIEHEITVADFRAGFVDYMAHFSSVLADEMDGRPSVPAPSGDAGAAPSAPPPAANGPDAGAPLPQ
jgi:hypothetical protein